jgi:hydrogenase expression/formation protein HypD
MKYLDEYRDVDGAKRLLKAIETAQTQDWTIMEICGGQTHSLVKNGILDVLPSGIHMVHGPGCPVCVTPMDTIDQAVEIATKPNVVLCSFGDMLRVPGNDESLLSAKSKGADIRVVYSPLEAVQIAARNPEKEVVFFGVGFETTAPANGLAILQAAKLKLNNFSMLTSHVLVPPAMEAILGSPNNQVQGFLAAGHVCAIMGIDQYQPIAERFGAPIVITGFEPIDLLQGILALVTMLEEEKIGVDNAYARVVRLEGNQGAQALLTDVFDVVDKDWRGLGSIPQSGLAIRPAYAAYDASKKFQLQSPSNRKENGCIAGQVLTGSKKPKECPYFGKECKPERPMGAPMVSSEGACAAYFHFHHDSSLEHV